MSLRQRRALLRRLAHLAAAGSLAGPWASAQAQAVAAPAPNAAPTPAPAELAGDLPGARLRGSAAKASGAPSAP